MSKYKAGDKFVCEIREVIKSDNGTLYRGKFSTLVFDDYGLDKLQKYEEPDTAAIYEAGGAAVWELMKKIFNMDSDDIERAFISDTTSDMVAWNLGTVLEKYTPEEAYEKLKMYEDEKKIINYGDEVHFTDKIRDKTGIVLKKSKKHYKGDANLCILWKNGSTSYMSDENSDLVKTGRNFADKLDDLVIGIGGSDGKEETDS